MSYTQQTLHLTSPKGLLLGAGSSDGQVAAPCHPQLIGTAPSGSKEIVGGSGEGLDFLWILELTRGTMRLGESHSGKAPDHRVEMSESVMVPQSIWYPIVGWEF